jgi:hypothetical protein
MSSRYNWITTQNVTFCNIFSYMNYFSPAILSSYHFLLTYCRQKTLFSLDIRAGARPVKQPLRRFDEEKRRAIGEEIHKLMAAGFIKEVFHPEWLANPVLVRKKGGK